MFKLPIVLTPNEFKIINNWFDSADVSAARHYWTSKTYPSTITIPGSKLPDNFAPAVAVGSTQEIYVTVPAGLDVYDGNADASEDDINPSQEYVLPNKNSHPSTLTVSNTGTMYATAHDYDNDSNSLFTISAIGKKLVNIMELTETLDGNITSNVIDDKNAILYLLGIPTKGKALSPKSQLVAIDLRKKSLCGLKLAIIRAESYYPVHLPYRC